MGHPDSDHATTESDAAPLMVSVVVPTLGNYAGLSRVLDGYDRQTVAADSFEVIVVSDVSEPNPTALGQVLGRRRYELRLLHGSKPGASANRNVGWKEARAPIVLFTDNDTVPRSDLVSQHLRLHRAWPQPEVAVAGLVRWAPEVRVTPFMRWLEDGVQFDFKSLSGDQGSWAHVYSANASIKREFMQIVGGYDEDRLPYGYEDLDWGYRARAHGLRVIFNREAVVDHWRTMSVEDWQTRAARLAISEWRFCQMHPDVPPWFWRMFHDAAIQPPAGQRAGRLVALIPYWVPWLGPRIWRRATLQWRQAIAPHFLAVWNQLAEGGETVLEPGASALAERGESFSGSPPGGPK
jgi:GT2 family glycosyltransferase